MRLYTYLLAGQQNTVPIRNPCPRPASRNAERDRAANTLENGRRCIGANALLYLHLSLALFIQHKYRRIGVMSPPFDNDHAAYNKSYRHGVGWWVVGGGNRTFSFRSFPVILYSIKST